MNFFFSGRNGPLGIPPLVVSTLPFALAISRGFSFFARKESACRDLGCPVFHCHRVTSAFRGPALAAAAFRRVVSQVRVWLVFLVVVTLETSPVFLFGLVPFPAASPAPLSLTLFLGLASCGQSPVSPNHLLLVLAFLGH